MSSTRKETNPLRKRRLWWLHRDFFLFIGFYLLCSALFLSIVRVRELAFQLAGIFWLIMLPIIIWLYRRTIFEDYSVDHSVVRRTRRGILANRKRELTRFLQNDIALLRSGVKAPVLDIWRLKDDFRKLHLFFGCLEVISIDPRRRELAIRIQVGDTPLISPQGTEIEGDMRSEVCQFLSFIARDPYLNVLGDFFDTLVLEIYGFRSGETLGRVPYPLLSLEMNARVLWNVGQVSRGPRDLLPFVAMRFNNGEEIAPHRSIEPPGATSK